jgi:hypothetical protein
VKSSLLWSLVGLGLAVACGNGCYGSPASGTAEDDGGVSPTSGEAPGPSTTGGTSSNGTSGGTTGSTSSGTSTGGTTGGTEGTGLPCALETLFRTACQRCHGATNGAAGVSLTNRDDLVKALANDPNTSVAEASLARMKSTARPMPPPPNARATQDQIAALDAWLTAGTPVTNCNGTPDAGTPPPPPPPTPDAGPPPPPPPTSVCTSGTQWTSGDRGSSSMHPGAACIDCHTRRNGPTFSIAGTLYPTAHEPSDCNGTNRGNATVVITDANGVSTTLTVNAAGNFARNLRTFKAPYTAKVVSNGTERVMTTPQTSGDCNGCHTEAGSNGAPGRIQLP